MKRSLHTTEHRISPLPLAYACAILPWVAVHLSYVISASTGQVEWCNPYWDSCTSISNAGRKHPSAVVFKPLMIVSAVMMMAYWYLVIIWLQQLGDRNPRIRSILSLMGAYAGLALILYSATLGSAEAYLKSLRRIGITLFFSLTAFAHLLMVYRLAKLDTGTDHPFSRLRHGQEAISYLMVAMGVLSGLLSAFYSGYKQIDDAFEWCFAMIMILQFPITGHLWKRVGFSLRLTQK